MTAIPYASDAMPVPCALAEIDKAVYHLAAGMNGSGGSTYDFKIIVIVARSDAASAVEAIEGYMSPLGPSSISAAIEAVDGAGQRTLGGVVEDALCKDSGPLAGLSMGTSGAEYITVPFSVQVIA
jgi:hypothetical protein